MECPKVSIILPCYNVEQYIQNVYKSITKSLYFNYEIIFVNDGSLDNTKTEIEKLDDYRVVLVNKANGGVSSARNAGLKVATGKYIIFVDPDDEISESLLSEVVNCAENTQSDFVIYGYRRENIDSPEESEDVLPLKMYNYENTNDIINGFLPSIVGISKESIIKWQNGGNLYWNKEWGAVWRALYRREIIEANKISFDETLFLNEDSIFTCNYLCYAKKMTTINKCFYTYRVKSTGAMYSSINGEKLLVNKISLANAREQISKKASSIVCKDISDWYIGSLVLSVLELYIGIAKDKNWWKEYKNCCYYTNRIDVRKAVKKIPLGKKIKFAAPVLLLKLRLDIVLYGLIRIMGRLGISISI